MDPVRHPVSLTPRAPDKFGPDWDCGAPYAKYAIAPITADAAHIAKPKKRNCPGAISLICAIRRRKKSGHNSGTAPCFMDIIRSPFIPDFGELETALSRRDFQVLEWMQGQYACHAPNIVTGADCKAPSTQVCAALTPARFFDVGTTACVDFRSCDAPMVLTEATNACVSADINLRLRIFPEGSLQ